MSDPRDLTDGELDSIQILALSEIIREVDGNHGLGAAALAEAILSHPGSRWGRPSPAPAGELCKEEIDCETCEGSGTIDETLGGYGDSNPAATCPDCDGTGVTVVSAPAPAGEVGEPPAELVQQWYDAARGPHCEQELATQAARWGAAQVAERQAAPVPVAPYREVADLVVWLEDHSAECLELDRPEWSKFIAKAAKFLHLYLKAAPVPVAVSERLPQPEDCDAEGRCWWFCFECPGEHPHWILAKEVYCEPTYWLPVTALPLPGVEVEQ